VLRPGARCALARGATRTLGGAAGRRAQRERDENLWRGGALSDTRGAGA
jgi:hypothetical protein